MLLKYYQTSAATTLYTHHFKSNKIITVYHNKLDGFVQSYDEYRLLGLIRESFYKKITHIPQL